MCNWDASNGLYYCEPCSGPGDQSFPTLRIRMGSILEQHWFEILPEDYLI